MSLLGFMLLEVKVYFFFLVGFVSAVFKWDESVCVRLFVKVGSCCYICSLDSLK